MSARPKKIMGCGQLWSEATAFVGVLDARLNGLRPIPPAAGNEPRGESWERLRDQAKALARLLEKGVRT